jgi:hypothetical protein
MAKYSSADCGFLLIGGYSILGHTTELSESSSAEIKDKSALGMAWREHGYVGLKSGEIIQNGFWDDDTGATHDLLKAGNGTTRVGMFNFNGNTAGKDYVGWEGLIQVGHERKASVGEWHGAAGKYTISGAVDQGKILHALGAETTASNTEGALSQDAGASSANGGAGILECSSLTLGTATNFIAKIRHSADDITYADLITFTALTAFGAERKTVTGTVNRHLATAWAGTGWPGGGSTATFAIGFARAA